MTFTRHPVDIPVISQPWGANRTGGVTPNPNGTPIQQLVYNYGNYQPEGHDGIDYPCPIGTPVYAPGPGVIEWSGWGQDMPQHIAVKYGFVYGPGGWPSGILVCIDHGNGIGSYVAHLSESYWDAGKRVDGSVIVGLSGNTGRSGGPHVHFSAIRFPVNYSDPLYSRVNPLPLFTTVSHIPIRPGATGDPATVEKQPTKEWYEMALDNETKKEIHDAVWHGASGAKLVHNYALGRGEWAGTILGATPARLEKTIDAQNASINAQIKGLVGAITALSKGEPFDEAKLLAGVQAAAAAGVKDAINSIETTVNIKEQS